MAVCVQVQHYLHRLETTILSRGHSWDILVGTCRPRGDNEPHPRFLLSDKVRATYTKASDSKLKMQRSRILKLLGNIMVLSEIDAIHALQNQFAHMQDSIVIKI